MAGSVTRNFIGSATHKVDAKGRVSLPSDYRDVLREQGSPDGFILIPADDLEPMHVCMSRAGHSELIAMLSQQDYETLEEEQATRRRYIGNARPVSVEDGGRFVLSRELREGLALSGEARFVGDGGTFQIWQPAAYDALFGARAPAKPRRLRLSEIGQ